MPRPPPLFPAHSCRMLSHAHPPDPSSRSRPCARPAEKRAIPLAWQHFGLLIYLIWAAGVPDWGYISVVKVGGTTPPHLHDRDLWLAGACHTCPNENPGGEVEHTLPLGSPFPVRHLLLETPQRRGSGPVGCMRLPNSAACHQPVPKKRTRQDCWLRHWPGIARGATCSLQRRGTGAETPTQAKMARRVIRSRRCTYTG